MIVPAERPPTRIPSSTLGDVVPRDRAGVRLRRTGTVLLVAGVAAGAVGLVGVREGTVTATDGDLTLTVEYPAVARPGVDAAFTVTVSRPGGLGDPEDPDATVKVTLDRRYLDLWESQRFWPEPSAETAHGDLVELEFDVPEGDTLTVRYDAYFQPVAQRGGSGSVTAEVGTESATATFATTLMP